MPELRNRHHEEFVRQYIEGRRFGWNIGDCYQRAGFRSSGHSAEVNGSKLLKRTDIQARIAELGAPAVKKVKATAADLLEKTERVYDRAIEKDKLADANKAVELQGRLGGALIDRVEVGGVGEFDGCMTSVDVANRMIATLFGGSVQEALNAIDALRALVAQRASDQAIDTTPANTKSKETARAIELLRPAKAH